MPSLRFKPPPRPKSAAPRSRAAPRGALPAPGSLHEHDRPVLLMVAEAIRQRRVMLAYQPIVAAGRTGQPAFWEAMIRVKDSTGRTIPAGDFIDAVEVHELGREIDCMALEMGLAALAREPALRLAVNMSARSIGSARWTGILERGLAADATAAERLILEITESSAMMMPALVRAFMQHLHLRGVCFAIDDFGAGTTAFRYFRDFDFDILKIDGQFVRGVARNPDDQVLCHALISIARHFEMVTVAECVETATDARFLSDAGIDCLQGHHYGAAVLQPGWMDAGAHLATG